MSLDGVALFRALWIANNAQKFSALRNREVNMLNYSWRIELICNKIGAILVGPVGLALTEIQGCENLFQSRINARMTLSLEDLRGRDKIWSR